MTNNHPARFYTELDHSRLQCRLCPRSCVIKDQERGYCFGRRNQGGKLFLTTYGLTSGLAIDPIEKKPLYHFLPGSGILSFGTIGCCLGCRFCQNWSISHPTNFERAFIEASPQEIVQKARDLPVPAVAFTYNEPIVFAEYVMDTARACRSLGIRTVAVTSGYIAEGAREDFFKDIDAANVDLKGFTEDFYKKHCDGHLKPVLDTLIYLRHKTKVWLEITNLIIPTVNDHNEDIQRMTEWIHQELGPDVPVHFSAFHPDYEMLDKPWTSLKALRQARDIAHTAGLHYVYTGNVNDEEGSQTLCPSCHKPVIQRRGYQLIECAVEKNHCRYCGGEISGIFS